MRRSLVWSAIVIIPSMGCIELPPAPVTPEPDRLVLLAGSCQPQMRVGFECTMEPIAFDANGQETLLPIIEWSSSAPQAASVNNGRVRGLAVGNATIRIEDVERDLSAERDINILPGF